MKVWLVKLPNGDLRPLESNDIRRIGQGEAVEFEYKLGRNYKFLQKFFVFLKAVYDIEAIQKQFDSVEHLRYALTMDSGYFEQVLGMDGQVYLKPKSISFSKMDESEFDQFYAKVMEIVLKRLPDYVEGDIFEMENHIMSFA
ncbi:MAG: DUF1367 family protein [Thiohalomonadales bacterium]